jgi:hypothetical protein
MNQRCSIKPVELGLKADGRNSDFRQCGHVFAQRAVNQQPKRRIAASSNSLSWAGYLQVDRDELLSSIGCPDKVWKKGGNPPCGTNMK